MTCPRAGARRPRSAVDLRRFVRWMRGRPWRPADPSCPKKSSTSSTAWCRGLLVPSATPTRPDSGSSLSATWPPRSWPVGETDNARHAHTQWYLHLIVRLGERWRRGDDQGTWPIAARELPEPPGRLRSSRRDGSRTTPSVTVLGYGLIGCHFDSVPMYDWAPRAGSLDPGHVEPWTASVCAVAAWGAVSGRPRRRGGVASSRGQRDRGGFGRRGAGRGGSDASRPLGW